MIDGSYMFHHHLLNLLFNAFAKSTLSKLLFGQEFKCLLTNPSYTGSMVPMTPFMLLCLIDPFYVTSPNITSSMMSLNFREQIY
jgi:hypothetical protein